MKYLFNILLALFCALLTNCASPLPEIPKTPEELRAELKMQESLTPLLYLKDKKVTLQKKERLVRAGGLFRDPEYAPDGALIEGSFVNSATLAKFKDIVVKVSFFSQTKTLIKEESYVIYEYFEPNSTNHFSLRLAELPSAYKTFSLKITGAQPIFDDENTVLDSAGVN